MILEQTGDDPAADPVVYLAGGPGGSSLNGVPHYAELFAGFREHRDVILYDQRGTGRSAPPRCGS
ncbi:MAG: alpha/beta hydrolase [Chloroflexota bacterium]|nr:alpha/beta hydrolase [Chloroflexota bacterium]